jgi:hypothetical protein
VRLLAHNSCEGSDWPEHQDEATRPEKLSVTAWCLFLPPLLLRSVVVNLSSPLGLLPSVFSWEGHRRQCVSEAEEGREACTAL